MHQDDRGRDRDRADDEEPAPGRVVDDHSREDNPEAAADAEHRRDETNRDAHLLARELVPDDRERQREDGATGALNGTERDQ